MLTTLSLELIVLKEFYKKSKDLFKLGGFNLRKFLSNSDEVQSLIDETEKSGLGLSDDEASYAQTILGGAVPMNREESKVLGIVWHVGRDEIVIDIDHVYKEAVHICPTKRAL